jgi:Tol biopolymer transport system component
MMTLFAQLRAILLVITLLSVLVPIGEGSAAAVTADPPQIGFLSGETPVSPELDPRDVYVANADGTGLVNLTAGYGSGWQWAWSPDGSQISFMSDQDGIVKLYVRPLSGPEPFAVGVAPDPDAPMRWSPDGGSIAYVSGQDGNSEIYVADVATRTARNVSQDLLQSFDPRWSPTGSYLAYTVRGDETQYQDLYIVALSGGPPVNVTNDTAQSPGGTWSPDGSRFVFVTNRDGNDEIYVADADGRNPVRLTNNPANDRDPSWSPDGSQIAFSSGLETRGDGPMWETIIPSRIYVMDADGSNRRPVTDGSIDPAPPPPEYPSLQFSLAHTGATWSPDGSRLAVVVTMTGAGPHSRGFAVHTVDADNGMSQIKLVDGGGFWSVSWSPDGTRLAIQASGNYGIDGDTVIVSADGTGSPLRLTRGVGSGFAGWSTYGTHLAYMNSGSIQPGDTVFVASPDGTAPVGITASLDGPINSAARWRPQPTGPVGLVDTATGEWHLRDAWGWIRSFYYGDPGDLPFMGDWNCDGVETPGLFRQSDAFVYLRNSNDQGIADIRFFFGNPDDVPLAGDWNGDGCDTLSIYRPSEQRFYIINRLGENGGGLGPADFSFIFGNPGDKPVVGDWDGDGVDEVGLHRESNGFFYFRNTLTTGVADDQFFFGNPGDRFVAGDWGIVDGIDTPAVFRPAATTFYFRHTNTQGAADFQFVFGETGWLPVAGELGLH